MFYKREDYCRACGGANLQEILAFGTTPLADYLLAEARGDKDLLAPLTLALCTECSLAQILETVSPEVSFGEDYLYFSSVSKRLLQHFRSSALHLIESRKLGSNSWVVEAASNDGYMLKHFAEHGVPVLGVDPAPGPASAAERQGIPTLRKFFSKDLAHQLREQNPKGADVFLANNVLAHVPDLNGFVEGVRLILSSRGLAVIEVPYLVDLVNHCEFDTIYHQHLCYFSVTALDRLFRGHGLFLNDIIRTDIHGGSLRLFVEPYEAVQGSVRVLLRAEAREDIGEVHYYENFAARVRDTSTALQDFLRSLKAKGKRIAAYGAAAKATTLLSYAGIGSETLDFIADKNENKHGRYMGVNHLPIAPSSRLLEQMPDYVLILAWNFANEIMRDLVEYSRRGGQFIIPIPELTVVAGMPSPGAAPSPPQFRAVSP